MIDVGPNSEYEPDRVDYLGAPTSTGVRRGPCCIKGLPGATVLSGQIRGLESRAG